jgi:hypothetical protein
MEKEAATDLAPLIADILRSAPAPLRAVDIARQLAAGSPGAVVATAAVNKALCRGSFDRLPNAGAPAWKNRQAPPAEDTFVFHASDACVVVLRGDLPEEKVADLLACLASLAPNEAPRRGASPGGLTVIRLAASASASAGACAIPQ